MVVDTFTAPLSEVSETEKEEEEEPVAVIVRGMLVGAVLTVSLEAVERVVERVVIAVVEMEGCGGAELGDRETDELEAVAVVVLAPVLVPNASGSQTMPGLALLSP